MSTVDYLLLALSFILASLVIKKSGFIKWVAPSMEGKDGRSSARALTSFWYVMVNTFIAASVVVLAFRIAEQVQPTQEAVEALNVLKWLCVIFNTTILLIYGIVSAQNITEGIRAIRGDGGEPTIIENKTTITPGTNTSVVSDESKLGE